MLYLYVDDISKKEVFKTPKPGVQYCAWYVRGSRSYEFSDVINGEETKLRAMDADALEKFIRNAYHRVPYIKVMKIEEDES